MDITKGNPRFDSDVLASKMAALGYGFDSSLDKMLVYKRDNEYIACDRSLFGKNNSGSDLTDSIFKFSSDAKDISEYVLHRSKVETRHEEVGNYAAGIGILPLAMTFAGGISDINSLYGAGALILAIVTGYEIYQIGNQDKIDKDYIVTLEKNLGVKRYDDEKFPFDFFVAP